jgi:hypothetical protein
MTEPNRLPSHITEDDVRAVTRVVAPTLSALGWNEALEAAARGLEVLDGRNMLTLSNALEIIDSIRRADTPTPHHTSPIPAID